MWWQTEGQDPEAGSEMDADLADRLLIPRLPSFPVCAPDLRLEAEAPKPLSLL